MITDYVPEQSTQGWPISGTSRKSDRAQLDKIATAADAAAAVGGGDKNTQSEIEILASMDNSSLFLCHTEASETTCLNQ